MVGSSMWEVRSRMDQSEARTMWEVRTTRVDRTKEGHMKMFGVHQWFEAHLKVARTRTEVRRRTRDHAMVAHKT
jgi:hypothetical protein